MSKDYAEESEDDIDVILLSQNSCSRSVTPTKKRGSETSMKYLGSPFISESCTQTEQTAREFLSPIKM